MIGCRGHFTLFPTRDRSASFLTDTNRIVEKSCFLLFNMIGFRGASLSSFRLVEARFPCNKFSCKGGGGASLFSIWFVDGCFHIFNMIGFRGLFPLFILIGRGPLSSLQYIQLQGALSSLQYDWLAAASLFPIRLIGWRFFIFNLIGWGAASPYAIWFIEGMNPIPTPVEEQLLYLQSGWLCWHCNLCNMVGWNRLSGVEHDFQLLIYVLHSTNFF